MRGFAIADLTSTEGVRGFAIDDIVSVIVYIGCNRVDSILNEPDCVLITVIST